MKPRIVVSTFAALASCLMASATAAPLVTFEPDPSGLLPDGSLAVDNLAITNQFLPNGLHFGLDGNLDGLPDPGVFPHLETIGDDSENTYKYDGFGPDLAAAGFEGQLGGWFLRGPNLQPSPTDARPIRTLLIEYSHPVSHATGEIWDLDGGEQYEVQALRADRTIIDTVLSPAASGLMFNGLPWTWTVDHADADIHAIRLFPVGRHAPIGVGFNNISGESLFLLGDMDLNGNVDFDDVAPFVLGYTDESIYLDTYGVPPDLHGDINGSGIHDFDDIAGFVAILTGASASGQSLAIPEPSALVLVALGWFVYGWRPRRLTS